MKQKSIFFQASFAQPDADIGAVLPVIVACFTPGPLLLGAAVHMTLKALKKRSSSVGFYLIPLLKRD